MQPSHPQLVEIIREKIRSEGPVSFAWFMEQALYHPKHGYYSSGRATIGRHGDFFTNVSVGATFGRLLSVQFEEIWETLGTDRFVIVEQGAGNGDLAHDILEALQNRSHNIFHRVRYVVVEPFQALREQQAKRLSSFGEQVSWCRSTDDLEPFTGIYFANELLDAMPVHLVRRFAPPNGGGASRCEWREKFVALKNGEFVLREQEVACAELYSHLQSIRPAEFVPGSSQDIEVNLAALRWLDSIAKKIVRGVVLVFDYGFRQQELDGSDRKSGTLQCRAGHRLVGSPLERVGECDITAHLNWTTIAERATRAGFEIIGFCDQHHFLTGIVSQWPHLVASGDAKARRALQTLLHPEMLGRSFQALALARAMMRPMTVLSGFRFGRDAQEELGL